MPLPIVLAPVATPIISFFTGLFVRNAIKNGVKRVGVVSLKALKTKTGAVVGGVTAISLTPNGKQVINETLQDTFNFKKLLYYGVGGVASVYIFKKFIKKR